MATLSKLQISAYAAAAGLPQPAVWAAVAMAESSGRTDVVNSIGCVGLWQINQPVHVRSHPTWTVQWLKDPANNAKAAAVIYKAQGMRAWEAFTGPDGQGSDGPWRDHYSGDADKAAAKLSMGGGGKLGGGGGSFVDGLEEGVMDSLPSGDTFGGLVEIAQEVGRVAQGAAKAGNWLSNPTNWVRIGYVVGGVVLVGLGLQMVVQSKAVSRIAPLVGGAVKSRTRAVRAASGAKKAEKAKTAATAAGDRQKAAAAAARTQQRAAATYQNTLARERARQDARAERAAAEQTEES